MALPGDQRLSAAKLRLNEANASLESVQRRNQLIIDFCQGTANLYRHRLELQRQERLVRWVLEQMPLVEGELREAGGGGTSPSPAAAQSTHDGRHEPEGKAASYAVTPASVAAARRQRANRPSNGSRPTRRTRCPTKYSLDKLPSPDPSHFAAALASPPTNQPEAHTR